MDTVRTIEVRVPFRAFGDVYHLKVIGSRDSLDLRAFRQPLLSLHCCQILGLLWIKKQDAGMLGLCCAAQHADGTFKRLEIIRIGCPRRGQIAKPGLEYGLPEVTPGYIPACYQRTLTRKEIITAPRAEPAQAAAHELPDKKLRALRNIGIAVQV